MSSLWISGGLISPLSCLSGDNHHKWWTETRRGWFKMSAIQRDTRLSSFLMEVDTGSEASNSPDTRVECVHAGGPASDQGLVLTQSQVASLAREKAALLIWLTCGLPAWILDSFLSYQEWMRCLLHHPSKGHNAHDSWHGIGPTSQTLAQCRANRRPASRVCGDDPCFRSGPAQWRPKSHDRGPVKPPRPLFFLDNSSIQDLSGGKTPVPSLLSGANEFAALWSHNLLQEGIATGSGDQHAQLAHPFVVFEEQPGGQCPRICRIELLRSSLLPPQVQAGVPAMGSSTASCSDALFTRLYTPLDIAKGACECEKHFFAAL